MQPITPPTDLLTLESLPFDTQKKVALNLPYETISSLCATSKKLKRICEDIYFWKDYLKIQVPVNINVPSGAGIRWYKDKIEQYPKVKVITDSLGEGEVTGKYIQESIGSWNIFKRIQNLQKLYCENNKLTSLPLMPNLQILYCHNNRLTYFPLMPNLQELYCQYNQLTFIPSMPSLQRLNCKNNQLTSLPNLRYLYCDNNPLSGFILS